MTEVIAKKPMSTSYKFVFLFSIFMVFFVLIVGAITHSKSSGFGMWVWGYTAWLMYKRRNSDLASMYKLLLWFDAIAIIFLVLIYAFNISTFSVFSSEDLLVAFIFLVVVKLITASLYLFFKSQTVDSSEVSIPINDDQPNDECWSKALSELNSGNIDDAAWARAFAESNGDESKAKASYLKIRASSLHRLSEKSIPINSNIKESKLDISSSKSSSWDMFEVVALVGLIIIVAAIVHAI